MVVGSTCFETQRGTAPCWNPRCEAVLYQNRFQKSLTIWMLQMRISNKKHASCIFNRNSRIWAVTSNPEENVWGTSKGFRCQDLQSAIGAQHEACQWQLRVEGEVRNHPQQIPPVSQFHLLFSKLVFFLEEEWMGSGKEWISWLFSHVAAIQKKGGFSHMRKGTRIQMEEHFFINGYLSN